MREELEDFKKGINQKLTETTKELVSQATRIELAEQRRERRAPESDLQIQRAHRSLMPRPASDRPPRSIVVNFLQYTTKEMVLKEAWKKRIKFQDRALFFDHDYATEILQKRKEYITIKKALKERGIRFQTPLSRLRIHWESGPRTYESAQEAADELNRRGIQIETSRGSAPGIEERLQKTLPWQRVGNSEDTAVRAKQRLQGFQRK
ncbi:hypothetical protein JOQ06_006576 [Pogonophryne albipinna]|uniref:L1 transposable element RRM domain-containing protein n=1 Tax=Pogonophryne albipinna TaxID=1090488 RepID=A0AAD6AXB9_9TELE|nr:hypothetical protein JOQ06_006576 [Pogonophryne albipinna]